MSEAEPMVIVESPPEVSNEEKFKLEKLDLPIKVKNSDENHVEQDKGLEHKVLNMIELAIKAVGNHKAKVTIEVELLD